MLDISALQIILIYITLQQKKNEPIPFLEKLFEINSSYSNYHVKKKRGGVGGGVTAENGGMGCADMYAVENIH